MTLAELIEVVTGLAEAFRTVLVPVAGVLSRLAYVFIRDFNKAMADNLAFQGEMVKCMGSIKEDLVAVKASIESSDNKSQSTVQDMNAMSKLQVSSESKLDSLGQQLARIEGGLNAR